MSLVPMKAILDAADKGSYGVGAYNVNNMEQAQGIMAAAAETNSPLIYQVSRGALQYSNKRILRDIIFSLVNMNPQIPVAVHLDHGNNPASCIEAIGLGFTSVMMDGSLLEDGKTPSKYEYNREATEAVVDYAHTGDALFRLLTTIRNLAKARVITVFGCGGNRDRGKRPIMGEVAARLSDIVIITSDNPRNEDPLEIIREIEKGIKTGVKKVSIEEFAQHSALNTQHCFYAVIPDRREAIEKAVNIARKDDFVVIAGKGHEKCQITGDSKILFDDVEEVKRAIRAMEQKCLN